MALSARWTLGALMNLRCPEAVGWMSVVVANTSARVRHAAAIMMPRFGGLTHWRREELRTNLWLVPSR